MSLPPVQAESDVSMPSAYLSGQIIAGTTNEVSGASEQAPDLAAFAKALGESGTQFFGAAWSAPCTTQKELFEDGASFLPFVEVTNPDRTLNAIAVDNNISAFPTWDFPGGNRVVGVLDLQTISSLSGIPIPSSNQPSLRPVNDATLLSGSPLHIALDGYDPNGDALTYAVTSSNPLVTPTLLSGNRSVRISTEGWGDMVFQLFEQQTPRPTGRFVDLADSGSYDGIPFHRVVENFVIQGGDPTGTGAGGSALGPFDDQFDVDLQHNQAGVLSFAKGVTDDTSDSQFFVTLAPTRILDFNYSVFGQIVEGQQTLTAIGSTATDGSDRPLFNVTMETVQVFQDTENALLMLKADSSASGQTADITVTVSDPDGNTSQQTFHVLVAEDPYNGGAFLADLQDLHTPINTPVQFTLTAVDVEGDPVMFTAQSVGNVPAQVDFDSLTGQVTVTPPAGYVGPLEILVAVRQVTNSDTSDQWDSQRVTILVFSDAPFLDLLSGSDSNTDTDNVTNVADMMFQVRNVHPGGLVQLQFNGTMIGQAVAVGDSVFISSDALGALGDGDYELTAVEFLDGAPGNPSNTLLVTLDTTVPDPLAPVPLLLAETGLPLTYDVDHIEEGIAGFSYRLVGAPFGTSFDSVTGQFSWTPAPDQGGTTTFLLQASDLAGNTVSQSVQIDVAVVEPLVQIRLETTDLDGNPISVISPGRDFLLSGYVHDLRLDGEGVFAAYLDVLYDSSLVSAVDQTVDDIFFGDAYSNGKSGSLASAGLIDEVGAFASSITPLGSAEQLLFTVQLTANAEGSVLFNGDTADGAAHEVLLYGFGTPLATNQVTYWTTTLAIGSELVATDDSFSIDEDSESITLPVRDNDTAFAPFIIVSVGPSSVGGAVRLDNTSTQLIYTPPANFFGQDSFEYTISDGILTSSATVYAAIYPVNDPPTALADEYEVDAYLGQQILDALRNDTSAPDEHEVLTLVSVEQPSQGGSVVIAPDGLSLWYTPAPSFLGTETFVYHVADGNGGEAAATVTVTVVPHAGFVDADNNGRFDTGIDVPLVRGELEDGAFNTNKKEGGYTTVIAGAGLVIKVGITGREDLDFRADGSIVVQAPLHADRDVYLRGRSIDVHAGMSAGRDVDLRADVDLGLWGIGLTSTRDIQLNAGGSIRGDGSSVFSQNRDVLITAQQDIAFNGAFVTARRDIIVQSDGYLAAANATFEAGRDVALSAKRPDFEMVEVYLPSPWLQVAMTLDFVTIKADRDIALKADQGSVAMFGATASGGKTIKVTARDKIFAELADATAGKEITFTSDSIVGSPFLHAPKIKLKTR